MIGYGLLLSKLKDEKEKWLSQGPLSLTTTKEIHPQMAKTKNKNRKPRDLGLEIENDFCFCKQNRLLKGE